MNYLWKFECELQDNGAMEDGFPFPAFSGAVEVTVLAPNRETALKELENVYGSVQKPSDKEGNYTPNEDGTITLTTLLSVKPNLPTEKGEGE